MAFSRKRKWCSKQGEGFGKMGSEPASSLSSIMEISLADESQSQSPNALGETAITAKAKLPDVSDR
jgi:hypothetical protein